MFTLTYYEISRKRVEFHYRLVCFEEHLTKSEKEKRKKRPEKKKKKRFIVFDLWKKKREKRKSTNKIRNK